MYNILLHRYQWQYTDRMYSNQIQNNFYVESQYIENTQNARCIFIHAIIVKIFQDVLYTHKSYLVTVYWHTQNVRSRIYLYILPSQSILTHKMLDIPNTYTFYLVTVYWHTQNVRSTKYLYILPSHSIRTHTKC